MDNEILFINITSLIAGISVLIGLNVVIIYSMRRQKLSFYNIANAFKIMAGFTWKEWVLFILLVINFFSFSILSGTAYNKYLNKHGVKPKTWIF